MTKSQKPELRTESSAVEKRLRQSAPDLPIVLKNRTLAHCKARVAQQQHRQRRLNWQLTWVALGIVTMQSLTLFVVDAQRTQLLDGNSHPPLFASLSLSQVNQLWQQRSRQLAQLMKPTGVG